MDNKNLCTDLVLFSEEECLKENTYILQKEKNSNEYCILLEPELFSLYKKINFINEEKNNISTIIINNNTINLDAFEDIIFIGCDFSEFDLSIKSLKNIIFKGTMILNRLDINSLNFSFQNLTANNLTVTVFENLIGVGILNLQDSIKKSELNASLGIILKQDSTIIGCLLLKAKSIIISALLAVGNGDLKINVDDEFINYGTITCSDKIILKGNGNFTNTGKILSNDTLILEGIENGYINLKNLQNGTISSLSESIIGVHVNIENYGVIDSNLNIDFIGKILISYGKIISQGKILISMDNILQMGDLISQLEMYVLSNENFISIGLTKSETSSLKIQSQKMIHKGHFESQSELYAEVSDSIESFGSIITEKIIFNTNTLKISGKIYSQDDITFNVSEAEITESIDGKNITINDAKKVIFKNNSKIISTSNLYIKTEVLECYCDRLESKSYMKIIANKIHNSSIIKSNNMNIEANVLNNTGLIKTIENFIFKATGTNSSIKSQTMDIGGDAIINVDSFVIITKITSNNAELFIKNLMIGKDTKLQISNDLKINNGQKINILGEINANNILIHNYNYNSIIRNKGKINGKYLKFFEGNYGGNGTIFTDDLEFNLKTINLQNNAHIESSYIVISAKLLCIDKDAKLIAEKRIISECYELDNSTIINEGTIICKEGTIDFNPLQYLQNTNLIFAKDNISINSVVPINSGIIKSEVGLVKLRTFNGVIKNIEQSSLIKAFEKKLNNIKQDTITERYVDMENYNKYKKINDEANNQYKDASQVYEKYKIIFDAKIKYDNEYWNLLEKYMRFLVQLQNSTRDGQIDINTYIRLSKKAKDIYIYKDLSKTNINPIIKENPAVNLLEKPKEKPVLNLPIDTIKSLEEKLNNIKPDTITERFVNITEYNKYQEICDDSWKKYYSGKAFGIKELYKIICEAKVKYDNEYWNLKEKYMRFYLELENALENKIIDKPTYKELYRKALDIYKNLSKTNSNQTIKNNIIKLLEEELNNIKQDTITERYVDMENYNKYQEIYKEARTNYDKKQIDLNELNKIQYEAKIKYDNEYWNLYEKFVRFLVILKNTEDSKQIDTKIGTRLKLKAFDIHKILNKTNVFPKIIAKSIESKITIDYALSLLKEGKKNIIDNLDIKTIYSTFDNSGAVEAPFVELDFKIIKNQGIISGINKLKIIFETINHKGVIITENLQLEKLSSSPVKNASFLAEGNQEVFTLNEKIINNNYNYGDIIVTKSCDISKGLISLNLKNMRFILNGKVILDGLSSIELSSNSLIQVKKLTEDIESGNLEIPELDTFLTDSTSIIKAQGNIGIVIKGDETPTDEFITDALANKISVKRFKQYGKIHSDQKVIFRMIGEMYQVEPDQINSRDENIKGLTDEIEKLKEQITITNEILSSITCHYVGVNKCLNELTKLKIEALEKQNIATTNYTDSVKKQTTILNEITILRNKYENVRTENYTILTKSIKEMVLRDIYNYMLETSFSYRETLENTTYNEKYKTNAFNIITHKFYYKKAIEKKKEFLAILIKKLDSTSSKYSSTIKLIEDPYYHVTTEIYKSSSNDKSYHIKKYLLDINRFIKKYGKDFTQLVYSEDEFYCERSFMESEINKLRIEINDNQTKINEMNELCTKYNIDLDLEKYNENTINYESLQKKISEYDSELKIKRIEESSINELIKKKETEKQEQDKIVNQLNLIFLQENKSLDEINYKISKQTELYKKVGEKYDKVINIENPKLVKLKEELLKKEDQKANSTLQIWKDGFILKKKVKIGNVETNIVVERDWLDKTKGIYDNYRGAIPDYMPHRYHWTEAGKEWWSDPKFFDIFGEISGFKGVEFIPHKINFHLTNESTRPDSEIQREKQDLTNNLIKNGGNFSYPFIHLWSSSLNNPSYIYAKDNNIIISAHSGYQRDSDIYAPNGEVTFSGSYVNAGNGIINAPKINIDTMILSISHKNLLTNESANEPQINMYDNLIGKSIYLSAACARIEARLGVYGYTKETYCNISHLFAKNGSEIISENAEFQGNVFSNTGNAKLRIGTAVFNISDTITLGGNNEICEVKINKNQHLNQLIYDVGRSVLGSDVMWSTETFKSLPGSNTHISGNHTITASQAVNLDGIITTENNLNIDSKNSFEIHGGIRQAGSIDYSSQNSLNAIDGIENSTKGNVSFESDNITQNQKHKMISSENINITSSHHLISQGTRIAKKDLNEKAEKIDHEGISNVEGEIHFEGSQVNIKGESQAKGTSFINVDDLNISGILHQSNPLNISTTNSINVDSKGEIINQSDINFKTNRIRVEGNIISNEGRADLCGKMNIQQENGLIQTKTGILLNSDNISLKKGAIHTTDKIGDIDIQGKDIIQSSVQTISSSGNIITTGSYAKLEGELESLGSVILNEETIDSSATIRGKNLEANSKSFLQTGGSIDLSNKASIHGESVLLIDGKMNSHDTNIKTSNIIIQNKKHDIQTEHKLDIQSNYNDLDGKIISEDSKFSGTTRISGTNISNTMEAIGDEFTLKENGIVQVDNTTSLNTNKVLLEQNSKLESSNVDFGNLIKSLQFEGTVKAKNAREISVKMANVIIKNSASFIDPTGKTSLKFSVNATSLHLDKNITNLEEVVFNLSEELEVLNKEISAKKIKMNAKSAKLINTKIKSEEDFILNVKRARLEKSLIETKKNLFLKVEEFISANEIELIANGDVIANLKEAHLKDMEVNAKKNVTFDVEKSSMIDFTNTKIGETLIVQSGDKSSLIISGDIKESNKIIYKSASLNIRDGNQNAKESILHKSSSIYIGKNTVEKAGLIQLDAGKRGDVLIDGKIITKPTQVIDDDRNQYNISAIDVISNNLHGSGLLKACGDSEIHLNINNLDKLSFDASKAIIENKDTTVMEDLNLAKNIGGVNKVYIEADQKNFRINSPIYINPKSNIQMNVKNIDINANMDIDGSSFSMHSRNGVSINSNIQAEYNLSISSNDDITCRGGKLKAGRDLEIKSRGNLILEAIHTRQETCSKNYRNNYEHSEFQSGGKLKLLSNERITGIIHGSGYEGVEIYGNKGIQSSGFTETFVTRDETKSSWLGFVKERFYETSSQVYQSVLGSSKGNVSIVSNNKVDMTGVQIVSNKTSNISSSDNIDIRPVYFNNIQNSSWNGFWLFGGSTSQSQQGASTSTVASRLENVEVCSIDGRIDSDGTKFLAPNGSVILKAPKGISNKGIILNHSYDRSQFTFAISSAMPGIQTGSNIEDIKSSLEGGSINGAVMSAMSELCAIKADLARSRATMGSLAKGAGVDALKFSGATNVNLTFTAEKYHKDWTTFIAGEIASKEFIVVSDEIDLRGTNVNAKSGTFTTNTIKTGSLEGHSQESYNKTTLGLIVDTSGTMKGGCGDLLSISASTQSSSSFKSEQYNGDFKVMHLNIISPEQKAVKIHHTGNSAFEVESKSGDKVDLEIQAIANKNTFESNNAGLTVNYGAKSVTGSVNIGKEHELHITDSFKDINQSVDDIKAKFKSILGEDDTITVHSIKESHESTKFNLCADPFALGENSSGATNVLRMDIKNNNQQITFGIVNAKNAVGNLKNIVDEIEGNINELGNIMSNPTCLTESFGEILKESTLAIGYSLEKTFDLINVPEDKIYKANTNKELITKEHSTKTKIYTNTNKELITEEHSTKTNTNKKLITEEHSTKTNKCLFDGIDLNNEEKSTLNMLAEQYTLQENTRDPSSSNLKTPDISYSEISSIIDNRSNNNDSITDTLSTTISSVSITKDILDTEKVIKGNMLSSVGVNVAGIITGSINEQYRTRSDFEKNIRTGISASALTGNLLAIGAEQFVIASEVIELIGHSKLLEDPNLKNHKEKLDKDYYEAHGNRELQIQAVNNYNDNVIKTHPWMPFN